MTIWERTTRAPLWSKYFDDKESLSPIRYSPDGNKLAWNTQEGLRILSLPSGAITPIPLNGNADEVVRPVAFSPDGLELAYSCRTQLLVLDLTSLRPRLFAPTDEEVFAINYSPDGKRMVFGDRLGSLTMCDRSTGQILFKTNAHSPHVLSVEFSGNGRLLATAGSDALIKLWIVHPNSLTLKSTLRGHRGYVRCSFSPDASRLVSGATDQMLKLWDVKRGDELATFYGHTDYLSYEQFAEDGNTLYSIGFGDDRPFRYWEAPPLDQIDKTPRSTSVP